MKKAFVLLFLLSACGHDNGCSKSTDRGPLALCGDSAPIAAPPAPKPCTSPSPSPVPQTQPCGCPIGKPHKPGCKHH